MAMRVKYTSLYLPLIIFLFPVILLAQTSKKEFSVTRFQSAINQFLQQDSIQPPPMGAIEFVGSSIFRQWATLTEDMAPLPVYNRAFGGSRTAEVLYYVDKIVLPYEPKIIVYYCGSNDINAGERPGEIAGRFFQFCQRVNVTLPQTKIFYVSINRAPQKMARWSTVDSTNDLVKAFCQKSPSFEFIDVNPVLFKANNSPRYELFLNDKLHLQIQAYREFTKIIKPILVHAWESVGR
jgi:lysophospholipase L1-like esterase